MRPMKLSEAILLGSVGSEQGFGPLSIYTESRERCALGAALLAVGQEASMGDERDGAYARVLRMWPWAGRPATSPVVGLGNGVVVAVIWKLNDFARWTRPQIAAWVASIEPADEQPIRVPMVDAQQKEYV